VLGVRLHGHAGGAAVLAVAWRVPLSLVLGGGREGVVEFGVGGVELDSCVAGDEPLLGKD
jgi:hypothetical protein